MIRILVGDARRRLRELPAASVHCCMTSSPYFALRDYETAGEVWDGDPDHAHEFNLAGAPHRARWGNLETLSDKQSSNRGSEAMVRGLETSGGRFCECGAWLGSLGLEPLPEMFVEHLCTVMDEVWRVLRDDGILWLNLGDSFAGSGKGRNRDGTHSIYCGDKQHTNRGTISGTLYSDRLNRQCRGYTENGVKPSDLYGIPWMVAFALRERGWYLRRDNIWWKPNSMPEPVDGTRWERCRVKLATGGRKRQGDPGQLEAGWFAHQGDIRQPPKQDGHGPRHAGFNDRYFKGNDLPVYLPCEGCKKCLPNDGWVLRKSAGRASSSHEYVFQLTKTDRYYYDNEAAKEASVGPSPWGGRPEGKVNDERAQGRHGATSMLHAKSREEKMQHYNGTRNRRSVWKIPTRPYSGAHFATFPPDLVKKCLTVSVSHYGVCSSCGAPWAPMVVRSAEDEAVRDAMSGKSLPGNSPERMLTGHTASKTPGWQGHGYTPQARVVGWRPTCTCEAEVGQPVVLDPFGGSATVAVEAERLGADSVMVELNPDYVQIGVERIKKALGEWTYVEVES